jgi:hypothetical protein
VSSDTVSQGLVNRGEAAATFPAGKEPKNGDQLSAIGISNRRLKGCPKLIAGSRKLYLNRG